MRLPRLFASIRFWLALCVIVRLGALLIMPIQKDAFLNRAMTDVPRVEGASPCYYQFLQRRTDFHPFTEDEHCYDEMAQNIRKGRGFVIDSLWVITTPGEPAMYGGCGYPLFLAAIYFILGNGQELPVFLLQIALQSLAIWFVFHTAATLGGNIAAVVAAAFFTFHPVLIWVSVSLMSEAILVPGMAALLWIVTCKNPLPPKFAVITGALLGFMALTRSTTAALVWLTVAWILWRKPRQFKSAALVVIVFLVVCAPWTIRNYIHWHRFIPFSTKSGVNAWFFNHPGLKVEFGRAAVQGTQPIDIFDPRIQSLPDEAARNDRLMAMFREFLREEPGKFAGLCWMRFWMAVLPARITSTTTTALISAWYAKGIPLLVCGAAAALAITRKRRCGLPSGVVFALLIAAYWQAIQTLAGPGLRYRLPVEPAWALMVGIAAACIVDMLKARADRYAD